MFSKHCLFILSLIMYPMLLSNPLFAQAMPGQWVDDKYSVLLITDMPPPRVILDEKNTVLKTIPHVSNAGEDFPVVSSFLKNGIHSYWHNEALYTLVDGLQRDRDGSVFKRFTYAKWQDGEWHFLGAYKAESDESLRAIPCDDDRVIVISRNADLADNNRPDRSPFVRMSIDLEKNELRLRDSINHGHDDLQKYMSSPDCFSLASSSTIVMTDGYATLINYRTGLYWVFSLEKASLVKAGNIFNKVTPEMIAKGGFQEAVLLANPEKAGTVLIATQEEAFFTTDSDNTGNVYLEMAEMRLSNPQMTQEEYIRLLNERIKRLRENSPYIDWYRLYPENGRVEKLPEPPEGGTHLRGENDENRHWRPMPDGSIKLESLDRTLFEARQKEKEITSDKDGNADKDLVQVVQHTP